MTDLKPDKLCPGCFADKGAQNPCPHCGYDEQTPRGPLVLPHRTLLHGQFLIGRVLGKPGGFGITYLAWDLQLHTRVAIKEYLPRELAGRGVDQSTVAAHSGEDAELFRFGLEQFLQEARTLAQLDHPNIVRVRHFFEANGTAYLVMDYYEGLSFAEYLEQQGGRLSEAAATQLLLPILDGLRAVHAKGFLHRDVKPQNIYLAKTDTGGARPILLDFGAARQAMGERSRSLSVVVSAGYAPFEQYHRKGKQGPWTDIYAAAVVLYQAMTGVMPPEATERITEDELTPASDFGVSQSLSEALTAALAVTPEARIQKIQEFQIALRHTDPAAPSFAEASRTNSSIPSQTEYPQQQTPKEKKHPTYERLAWLVPLLIVAGLGVLIAVVSLYQGEERGLLSEGENRSLDPHGAFDLFDDQKVAPQALIAGRYRDLGDGIVMDVQTGLQWMRCALGQTWSGLTCDDGARRFDWDSALAAAESLNREDAYAGYRDWRVPTINELKSLRYCKSTTAERGTWLNDELNCEGDFVEPTIEWKAFPNAPSAFFWSSSPPARGTWTAPGVYFSYAQVSKHNKGGWYYVRLVRGGQ